MPTLNMRKPLVLVGGGGHCRSCIELIEDANEFEIVAVVGTPSEVGTSILGYELKYCDDDLEDLVRTNSNFLISVGQIKTPAPRIRLFRKLQSLGAPLPSFAASSAIVSRHASVGPGTVVMHHAVVNAGASVGMNCIINTKSLVEHDATVGDHCHISTGTILNGHVTVGERTFVGSGTVCKQGISICPGKVVSAGQWISSDINAAPDS